MVSPGSAASGTAPSLPAPQTATHEVLHLVARQVALIPLPVFLSAMLIGALAWPSHPASWILAWLALVGSVLLLRWLYLRHPPRPGQPLGAPTCRATLLSGLNGGTHALSLLFFPGLGDLERAVLSMLLAGLSSAAVGSTAGHHRIYPAYAIQVMGGLALAWALSPSATAPGWLGGAMAVLIALYLMVLLSLARDNHQTLRRAVSLRRREFQLNEDLRRALAAAEHANAAKTRFLASASHDLRQPLHTLTLFAAALDMDQLSPRSQDIVAHMNTAIKALGGQLSGLLDLSRLDAGIVQPQARTVRLSPLLRQLETDYAPVAASKGLQLRLDCDDALGAHTDETHLGRIVRNLLDNALKYCDAGTVWLRAGWQAAPGEGPDTPAHAVITVQDTGRGIPAQYQQAVFEEFFQLDNPERDRGKGLGLGLSIVQRLCQLLDIGLMLRSEPGVGTCITLVLPPPHGALPALGPATAPAPAMPTCHMLVIDDESDVRAAMRTLLGSLGCRVSLAAHTDEAVRLACGDPPDIVLADLRLRGEESGIKAIRKLRQQQPGLPAVLISGDTAPDRLKEAGAEGLILLHKPVSVDTLLNAVQRALEAD